MPLLIGVPKESFPGEKRVATVPEVVDKLIKQGFRVAVESGAGDAAQIDDAAYRNAGADIIADRAALWHGADILFKVRAPSADEIGRLHQGSVLIGFLGPLTNPDTTQALASHGVTAFAVEAIPRISRAQAMDALSSQASIGG